MALAAKAHIAGQQQHLRSARNKAYSLRFLFSIQKPTVSKRVGQNFETLWTLNKKKKCV